MSGKTFINELHNEVTIEVEADGDYFNIKIIGPTSTIENRITKWEACWLQDLLDMELKR